jgi:hypothetical protein
MNGAEGYVSFRGLKTWYRVVGDTDQEGKHPIVALHGGLGATYHYIDPLEGLASYLKLLDSFMSRAEAGRLSAA